MFSGWGGTSLVVGSPWWLFAIALVVPPLVWLSRKSLSGLGRLRRAMAVLARVCVVVLLLLALSEPQIVRTSDKLTTIFLLDTSESIPNEWQRRMLPFVNAANDRQKRPDDLSGIVVFGADARVETPPSSNPGPKLAVENEVSGESTDLAAAIKLGLASFPEDTARRLVILSDGNSNRGDAMEQALAAAGLKVPIDVLPVDYEYDKEVWVEKVAVPPDVKQGETVNLNVVIQSSEPTSGTVQLFQKLDNSTVPLGGSDPIRVELQRGVNVLTMKHRIEEPRFYNFLAEFVPDPGSGDRRAVNNRALGFTQARGEANVLLIEGTAGEHAELVRALRENQIEVTIRTAPKIDGSGAVQGDPLPTDISELQEYDCVILGNVPKDAFSEQQQELLERNTHDFGSGLMMIGGPDSFGAGGWMNSPVERALPVDMQIRATRVTGIGALAMIMHASEIPEGNFWQKKVAQEALKTLSSYDYAGLLHWEGQEAWLFTVQPIADGRDRMLRSIDRMTPGDMPDFDPSLVRAVAGLSGVREAMSRHIIVISDGDPTPPTASVISRLNRAKITVTAVLVAAHGNDPGAMRVMQDLARRTGGRFYNVTNPKALPRIYQKEARIISRPLIYERLESPWRPVLSTYSEPVLGLPKELPGITGLVQASVKESELVEVPILSPLPAGTGQDIPVLAHWTYGLGRTVAFTSDAGRRWTDAWASWGNYSAFWAQLVRWTLRPVDRGNLALTLRRDGDQLKVVVDALDKDNRFLNFLQMQGVVLRPDLTRQSVELAQTAPGRYEGSIADVDRQGNYFVTLGYRGAGGEAGLVTSGVAVPYSDEYRELRSDPTRLESIADLTGGQRLKWRIRNGQVDLDATLAGADVFRRDKGQDPPRGFTDLWPRLLWLSMLFFLADVAVRRLAPDVARIKQTLSRAWHQLRGREVAAPSEYIEKLKGRKAEVAEQIDRSRGVTQFEPPVIPREAPRRRKEESPASEADLSPPTTPRDAGAGADAAGEAPPATPAQAGYADRLLRAKQKVWEERQRAKEVQDDLPPKEGGS